MMKWAEKQWKDSLSKTDVIRLSPEKKSHFRNPYYLFPMFTKDGQWAVMIEHSELQEGLGSGDKRLWARNLINGELRDLGPLPASADETFFTVSPHSHLINIIDKPQSKPNALIQVDIDSGKMRRIKPSDPDFIISEAVFSADDRYIYSFWAKEKEKNSLKNVMSYDEWISMMSSQPGYQEMTRMDLESGELESVFNTSNWWMGHPVPHPDDPELLMCCQTFMGTGEKWGLPDEYQRIRIFDIASQEWQDIFLDYPMDCVHEHWSGRRIYSHTTNVPSFPRFEGPAPFPGMPDLYGLHFINRIDLDAKTNEWFGCHPDAPFSIHVHISPDETFLVGDGVNFDYHNTTPDFRSKIRTAVRESKAYTHLGREPYPPGGAERIWKYELPEDASLWDYVKHGQDEELLKEDLRNNPELTVKASPICCFRTMSRTKMLGWRLESNANVTPDSQWVAFQSSSEDDWFEVWAARIPE